MKRLFFAIMCMVMLAGCSSNELTMFVGTYTFGGSDGIYSYSFNQKDGTWTELCSTKASNPSFLTLSSQGKFLYAVNENNDNTAAVEAFAVGSKGSLTSLGKQLTYGEDPCYVATNDTIVVTANYSGGNMSVFPVRKDGSLGEMSKQFKGKTRTVDTVRQATPHVHCAMFSPEGNYLFASDFSADMIQHYLVMDSTLYVDKTHPFSLVHPESGPRHIAFNPDGRFAYVIGELSGEISVFDYSDGSLTVKQFVDADPSDARGSADIHVSPDGKFLYASNRLEGDGIAIFSINADDGTLSDAGYQKTGLHPRNFAITPNGKYLLVACRDDNRIEVYSRNSETGTLSATGNDIQVSMPVCIIFK